MIPMLAYVDPSVMSYAVQAVAGVVIASGVIFGVVWRRLKRNAQKALHIDENAGKEVEAELKVSDDVLSASVSAPEEKDQ